MLNRLAILVLVIAFVHGCSGDTPASGDRGAGSKAGVASDIDLPEGVGDIQTVLARVGDRDLTAEAVYIHMQKLMGEERAKVSARNPGVLGTAISALMDQYVWEEMAKKEGIQLSSADHARLDALEAELYTKKYMADVMAPKVRPGPKEIEKAYRENSEQYLTQVRVGVRHILVDTEAEALQLKARADAGETFSGLARGYSKDEQTRDIGGALGFVAEGKRPLGFERVERGFETAVLPLEEGETVVVKSSRGWHVVRAEKREGGNLQPLAEVSDEIADGMARGVFARIYNEELDKARLETNASFDPEAIEKFTGVGGNVDRMMDEALKISEPTTKIEVYRRVTFDYRDSKRAPEAQFLIAYEYLAELRDGAEAERALRRLERSYPGSDWKRAGDILKKFLSETDRDDLKEVMGTPDEIFKRATGSK